MEITYFSKIMDSNNKKQDLKYLKIKNGKKIQANLLNKIKWNNIKRIIK